MIRNTLLKEEPGSQASFYPIPTTEFSNSIESAKAYETLIRNVCNREPPVFDLVLLGLGDDGHTG